MLKLLTKFFLPGRCSFLNFLIISNAQHSFP
nr:MAG TPA_asm: hypothetical protein [Inoviridae sp.]